MRGYVPRECLLVQAVACRPIGTRWKVFTRILPILQGFACVRGVFTKDFFPRPLTIGGGKVVENDDGSAVHIPVCRNAFVCHESYLLQGGNLYMKKYPATAAAS